MGFLAYDNAFFGSGTIADAGTDFSVSPPITNLGTRQVPAPYAEFTGATAEFTFTAAASFTVRVLALLGHNLPDGATVTWKDSGGTTIDSQTIARYKNRPNNSYILLSADETHTTISCAIANAGSGAHRIAAAWASPILSVDQSAGLAYRGQSQASITRISGTDWIRSDTRRRGAQFEFIGTRGEIMGVNFDGTSYSGTDFETVMQTAGLYGPVIVSPSDATQSAIDALAIYGALDSVGNPEHIEGQHMRARFSVLESR